MIKFSQYLLLEGGAGGRIPHPYEVVKTGEELIELFKNSINYINKDMSSLKLDGINVSIKSTKDGFALDRGSSKELDIKGVRPEDLTTRFEEGHGLIQIGKEILDIFDKSFIRINPELDALGLLNNPNRLLNIEYIDGKTNVIPYSDHKKFIIIHGVKEWVPKNVDKETGKMKSREFTDIEPDQKVLDSLQKKVQVIANKMNYDVIGMVGVELKKQPNLDKVLSSRVSFNLESRQLSAWLVDLQIPKHIMPRQEYIDLMKNSSKIPEAKLADVITYYATIAIGDEIKKNIKPEKFNDTNTQEGIVVHDPDYGRYKITGSFIIDGMKSEFNKEKIAVRDDDPNK